MSDYTPSKELQDAIESYVKEVAITAFEESRLTHPLIGFKHRTFEEFWEWRLNSLSENEM